MSICQYASLMHIELLLHSMSFAADCYSNKPFSADDITSENVGDHLLVLFSRFLGSLYFIDKSEHDPPQLGYPYARPRCFIRLRHRHKVVAQLSPLNEWSKRFSRAINFSWKEVWFMLGTADHAIETIPNEAVICKPSFYIASVYVSDYQDGILTSYLNPSIQSHSQVLKRITCFN